MWRAAGKSAGPIRGDHPGDCDACVEHLRPEQLPPCVLAFARQVRQLQAIVRDRGKRLEALEETVSIIAGHQIAAAPFC